MCCHEQTAKFPQQSPRLYFHAQLTNVISEGTIGLNKKMSCNDIILIEKITSLFKKRDITHWVDSGSLLGLYRDGCLIQTDNDIDLSIVLSQDDDIELISSLQNLNIGTFFIKKYKSKIHKIKIFRGRKQRSVDISIFREKSDRLLMPVLRLESISYNLGQNNYRKAGTLLFIKSLIEIKKKFNSHIDYSNRQYQSILKSGEYWEYPKEQILPVNYKNQYKLAFPRNTERYLKFRYGDWEVPIRNWQSEQSDNAFLKGEVYHEIL